MLKNMEVATNPNATILNILHLKDKVNNIFSLLGIIYAHLLDQKHKVSRKQSLVHLKFISNEKGLCIISVLTTYS